jgi:hypothetical protein
VAVVLIGLGFDSHAGGQESRVQCLEELQLSLIELLNN